MDLETVKKSTSLNIVTPSGEDLIVHRNIDNSFTGKSSKGIDNFINLPHYWIVEYCGNYCFEDTTGDKIKRYLIL